MCAGGPPSVKKWSNVLCLIIRIPTVGLQRRLRQKWHISLVLYCYYRYSAGARQRDANILFKKCTDRYLESVYLVLFIQIIIFTVRRRGNKIIFDYFNPHRILNVRRRRDKKIFLLDFPSNMLCERCYNSIGNVLIYPSLLVNLFRCITNITKITILWIVL